MVTITTMQGLILFKIDGDEWTLDLRPETEAGNVSQGPPPEGSKPDLTLTISDDNFVKLVNGKIGPQQVQSCMAASYQANARIKDTSKKLSKMKCHD